MRAGQRLEPCMHARGAGRGLSAEVEAGAGAMQRRPKLCTGTRQAGAACGSWEGKQLAGAWQRAVGKQQQQQQQRPELLTEKEAELAARNRQLHGVGGMLVGLGRLGIDRRTGGGS